MRREIAGDEVRERGRKPGHIVSSPSRLLCFSPHSWEGQGDQQGGYCSDPGEAGCGPSSGC